MHQINTQRQRLIYGMKKRHQGRMADYIKDKTKFNIEECWSWVCGPTFRQNLRADLAEIGK